MTSPQTQERRAIPLRAAKAEGATRSPHDAPSAPIREATDFPGPRTPAVSGGIPGTPSSDALRAQKSGGTGIPVSGRSAQSGHHRRKSLHAANEFTDVLGCGGASASSTIFGCETVSKGQPAGISRPLDDKLENRTVQDRPATILDRHAIRHMPVWMQEIVWTVSERHGVAPRDIVGGTRVHKIVKARHEAIYLVKAAKPYLSAPKLGQWFRRDHKTILYALAKYQAVNGATVYSRFRLRAAA